VRPLPTDAAPKISTLARLQARGLPVPDAVALQDTHEPNAAAWIDLDELLRGGPVIVRAALFEEDTPDRSAAGLGCSVAGCRDRAAIRSALAHIAAALAEPWLRDYFAGPPAAQVLVQHEIAGPWLAVVAVAGLRYAEIHSSFGKDRAEPLATGATPDLAGPLELLPEAIQRPIAELCARTLAALPDATHGLDLELVSDHDGAVWLVQARPLARPLHPGWPEFAAAARRDLAPLTCPEGQLPLPGLWVLDAEHNPDPLSPAHAGLILRLNATRPDLARMRVLAGWLYEPRSAGPPRPPATRDELLRALERLRARDLPAARAGLASISDAVADADAPGLAALLDRAVEHLVAVLDVYATLPGTRVSSQTRGGPPLCLEDRAAHLDVLPAAWDIASPTLHDLSPETADLSPETADLSPETADLSPETASFDLSREPADLSREPAAPDLSPEIADLSREPSDLSREPAAPDLSPEIADLSREPADLFRAPADDAATLAARLGELDDHLFALGLAPLRRVYLAAAGRLGLSAADVFLLPPGLLQAALRGHHVALDLPRRRAGAAAQARLVPPLQLFDGLPVPTSGGAWLRGLPIGPAAEGPLHPRRGLADLIARPPPPGAVLAIPALTAQAAVVLRALGLRAVCCEHGGAMSHAALMARELGLSALIGCRGCTTLPAGAPVRLDTRTGRLLRLAPPPAPEDRSTCPSGQPALQRQT